MMFRPITLQEANLFLPLVQEHFVHIQTLVTEGQSLHNQLLNLAPMSAVMDSTGGTSTTESVEVQSTQARLHEIELQIKDEVIAMQYYGAIVKSVFPARVDFLSQRHKQPVFLCWQKGDKTVSHWHPIEESFASRQVIKNAKLFGDVVVH